MLPKSGRLTKKDFMEHRPKVFFRGDFFDASYMITETQKFACIVAKKTFKTAVERNKIRRRVYNALKGKDINKKYSLIFYPKKTINTIPYAHLVEEILKASATLH